MNDNWRTSAPPDLKSVRIIGVLRGDGVVTRGRGFDLRVATARLRPRPRLRLVDGAREGA